MSQCRMQLFLSLDSKSAAKIADQLVPFAEQMQTVLQVRHSLWYKKASRGDLWEAQREYVRLGLTIAVEIINSLNNPMIDDGRGSTADERSALVHQLAAPLEKLSAAAVPYGSRKDSTWLGLWEVDTRPEWQKSREEMHQGTLPEFQAALVALIKNLDQRQETIETELVRIQQSSDDRVDVYCLPATFASEAELNAFCSEGFPEIRKSSAIAWYSFRRPVEFTLGVDKKRDASSSSEGCVVVSG